MIAVVVPIKNGVEGVNKMAPGKRCLGLIHGTHVVEEENQFLQLVL